MIGRRHVRSGANGERNGTTFLRRATSGRGEDGFSLIELIIVIIILPIVVGGIAVALIAILQNETTTFNRVADSADANITAANFVRDVQSSSAVTTAQSVNPAICGSLGAQSKPLVSLTWGGQEPNRKVSGLQLTGGKNTLGPVTPPGPSTPAIFTESDVGRSLSDSQNYIPLGTKIASYVDPWDVTMSATASFSSNNDKVEVFSPASVVTYWDVPVVSPTTTTYELEREICSQASGITPSGSQILAHDLPAPANQSTAVVTCTVPCSVNSGWVPTSSVSSISLSDDEALSGYQFNLSASPRYSSVAGGSVLPALLVTGSSVNLSNPNDILTVHGQLAFGSSAGSLNGVVSSAQVNATGGIGENSSASTSCSAVTSSFAGTCNGGPCPSATSISVPALSTVTQPPTPTGPVSTGCPMTAPGVYQCTPGYYPNSLNISGSVTFGAGNYYFSNSVNIGNAASVSFGAGDYTFGNGLNVGSSVSITGDGTVFYFAGGSLSTSAGDIIELAAPTTGPYAGLLAYQPLTDVSPMTLDSSSSGSVFGGVIEAPSAPVTLGANGDNITLGALVAADIDMGTAVSVTVGT